VLASLLGARRSHRFSRSVALKVNRVRFHRGHSSRVKKLGTRLELLVIFCLYYQAEEIDSISKREVNIGGGKAFRSRELSKVINGCEEIVCFLATIISGIFSFYGMNHQC
jgi:hypothetical protein